MLNAAVGLAVVYIKTPQCQVQRWNGCHPVARYVVAPGVLRVCAAELTVVFAMVFQLRSVQRS